MTRTLGLAALQRTQIGAPTESGLLVYRHRVMDAASYSLVAQPSL